MDSQQLTHIKAGWRRHWPAESVHFGELLALDCARHSSCYPSTQRTDANSLLVMVCPFSFSLCALLFHLYFPRFRDYKKLSPVPLSVPQLWYRTIHLNSLNPLLTRYDPYHVVRHRSRMLACERLLHTLDTPCRFGSTLSPSLKDTDRFIRKEFETDFVAYQKEILTVLPKIWMSSIVQALSWSLIQIN